MVASSGILENSIADTPIAIIDFETTGLTPGNDRVVEVSVVRIDPGEPPRLVLDTLVNPKRPVAATYIHGITDEDVADAPSFSDVAGDVVESMSDCVVSAYNVYFDIKFLNYELSHAGVDHEPPHFCLMYLRTMLGLGTRCKLEEACRINGIDHEMSHMAANDVIASAKLLGCYLKHLGEKGISTYKELARLKNYKFVNSFRNDPFPSPSTFNLSRSDRLLSRTGQVDKPDPTRLALSSYWDALRTVVADLEITDEEIEYVRKERIRLNLSKEQIRAMHGKAFASAISQFIDDRSLDDGEANKLRRLYQCLAKLGWAPGQ